MKKLFLSFALTLAFGAISSWAGSMTDSRDGQTYKTVKIGNQTWMAENLNYKVNDGEQSWCYDNKKSNCKKYGRLYTWAAAVGKSESQCGFGKKCNLRGQVQGVCPAGWHLPSKEEWETLFAAVGGDDVAGKKLKSTSGWNDYEGESGNGTDAFGFSVLPAGYLRYGAIHSEGSVANFWSATESEYRSGVAYYWTFDDGDDSVGWSVDRVDAGFSVRCLRNSN